MGTEKKEESNVFLETIVEGIRKYVNSIHGGNIASAKREFGMVGRNTLDTWLNGQRKPTLTSVGPVLERMCAKITFLGDTGPEPQTREICFVDAKVVQAGQGSPPPAPEQYIAVPLVGETGAGPGIVSQEKLRSWVLVYKHMRAVSQRHNFLAVEIGNNSRSMVPLLYPGDIVLVDLDDKGEISGFRPPGNTYLVREPGQEGGGKIKRVSVSQSNGDTILTYYSENVRENEPEPYSLKRDFGNDLANAIIGKVIWAWTDLTRK